MFLNPVCCVLVLGTCIHWKDPAILGANVADEQSRNTSLEKVIIEQMVDHHHFKTKAISICRLQN